MCLLNVIGARGCAVYDMMQLAKDGDKLKSDVVKKKFEEHCIPKQNELIKRGLKRPVSQVFSMSVFCGN